MLRKSQVNYYYFVMLEMNQSGKVYATGTDALLNRNHGGAPSDKYHGGL